MPGPESRNPTDPEKITIVEMYCNRLENTARGALLKSYDDGLFARILTEIEHAIGQIKQYSSKDEKRTCPDGTDECKPGICCPLPKTQG